MNGITSVEPITDGQEAQIKTFVGNALRKSGVGKSGGQLIIARGDALTDRLKLIFEELGIENQYADEKEEPNTDYSYDVATLLSIDEQIAKQLKAMGLTDKAKAIRCNVRDTVHPDADGIAVIPSLSDLGRLYNIADPLGDDYGVLLEAMLGYLSMDRGSNKFTNYLAGKLTKDYVRLHGETKQHWQKLESLEPSQEGKVRFFVIPVNFGKKYQGYSPRNARTDALAKGNMPLDPVSVGAILLGWLELQHEQANMVTDCPGAEYSWSAGGKWARSCYFYFDDSELKFGANDAGRPSDSCGTAVAFPGVLQLAD